MTAGLTGESDERLASRIAAGRDEEACTELFRRYRRRIYLWCSGYGRTPEEALDLTQEIFVRIFRGIGGFEGRSRFSTWVYRIARNHCLSAARRAVRREAVPIDDLDLEDDGAGEWLRQAEIAGELDHVLARAAEMVRVEELDAFVLHYRDGLSVNEITRTLGCTNASGARALIQGARRKLSRLVPRQETRHD
jgi:RNA polymerase sigma-70 factor (ECF subfamily)